MDLCSIIVDFSPIFYCLPKPLLTIIDIISTILLTMYYTTVFMFCYDWWLCMVINIISVQYNGGFLPDIILLTQGYYHWGTRKNTM